MYQDLYAKGYNYAGWALSVASGNTITGTAALDYLTGTALMGLGNTEVCRNLTPAQVDKIRVDMAVNTMKQMRLEANRTGGVLAQDLKYDRVEAAHETTFRANGLSLDNWTLNTPMTLYRKEYGDAVRWGCARTKSSFTMPWPTTNRRCASCRTKPSKRLPRS